MVEVPAPPDPPPPDDRSKSDDSQEDELFKDNDFDAGHDPFGPELNPRVLTVADQLRLKLENVCRQLKNNHLKKAFKALPVFKGLAKPVPPAASQPVASASSQPAPGPVSSSQPAQWPWIMFSGRRP